MTETTQLIVAIVTFQVALAGLLTWWMGRQTDALGKVFDAKTEGRDRTLDAKVEGIGRTLDARAEGIGQALDAKISRVEQAVAVGAEEHKAWREELDRTNKRLDDLLIHLMSRDNAK